MSASWEEIYNGYSVDEIREERTRLKKQLDHAYRGQSTGGKSYEKDLNHLTARFQSLTRVMRERGIGMDENGVGVSSGGSIAPAGGAFKGQVDMSGPDLCDF
jgi:hypothetical protein